MSGIGKHKTKNEFYLERGDFRVQKEEGNKDSSV